MTILRALLRHIRQTAGTVIRRGRFAKRRRVGTLSITITPPSPEVMERFRAALEEAIIRGDHLTTARAEIERMGRAHLLVRKYALKLSMSVSRCVNC